MKTATPWSIKGIDPEARAAAKEAAKREGMTLGAWITQKIIEENSEGLAGEATVVRAQRRMDPQTARREKAGKAPQETDRDAELGGIDVGAFAAALRDVAERTQRGERRSEERVDALRATLEEIVSRVDGVAARMGEVSDAVQTISGGLERTAERAERAETEASALRLDMTETSDTIAEMRDQTGATARAAAALIDKVDALTAETQNRAVATEDNGAREALEALSERLATLSERSDTVAEQTQSAFEALVARLDEANSRQERTANAIGDAIEALTQRLEAVEEAQLLAETGETTGATAIDDVEDAGQLDLDDAYEADEEIAPPLPQYVEEEAREAIHRLRAQDTGAAQDDWSAYDEPYRQDAAPVLSAETRSAFDSERSAGAEREHAAAELHRNTLDALVAETDASLELAEDEHALDRSFEDELVEDRAFEDADDEQAAEAVENAARQAEARPVRRERDFDGPPSLAALRERLRQSTDDTPPLVLEDVADPVDEDADHLDMAYQDMPDQNMPDQNMADQNMADQILSHEEAGDETRDAEALFAEVGVGPRSTASPLRETGDPRYADAGNDSGDIPIEDLFGDLDAAGDRESVPAAADKRTPHSQEDFLTGADDAPADEGLVAEAPRPQSRFSALRDRFRRRKPEDRTIAMDDDVSLGAFSDDAEAGLAYDGQDDAELWEEFEMEEAPRANRIVTLLVLGLIAAMLGAGLLYIYTAFSGGAA